MKSIAIKMPVPKPVVDDWVRHRDGPSEQEIPAPVAEPAPAEVMKRLTIDVSETLHKRMKAQCALRGEKMADVVRLLLEREFPAS